MEDAEKLRLYDDIVLALANTCKERDRLREVIGQSVELCRTGYYSTRVIEILDAALRGEGE